MKKRKNFKRLLKGTISIESLFSPGVRKENQNRVIFSDMPDGENYFQGVTIHKIPNEKTGGYLALPAGVWTIHFDDLKPGAGLFTQEEAEYYVKEIIAMDGVNIGTWDEAFDRREKLKN